MSVPIPPATMPGMGPMSRNKYVALRTLVILESGVWRFEGRLDRSLRRSPWLDDSRMVCIRWGIASQCSFASLIAYFNSCSSFHSWYSFIHGAARVIVSSTTSCPSTRRPPHSSVEYQWGHPTCWSTRTHCRRIWCSCRPSSAAPCVLWLPQHALYLLSSPCWQYWDFHHHLLVLLDQMSAVSGQPRWSCRLRIY